MNYYEILQVLPSALPEVIHMAYKALAKKYHPDVYTGDKKYAEEKMKLITAAYRVLSDPQQRLQYDNTYFKKNNNTEGQNGSNAQNGSGTQSATHNQSATSQIERVIRLFNLMFKGFIEHNRNATAHLCELLKLTASDNTFQYVLKELEKNFDDSESDFLLPGAMLIVLDKYKNYSTLNEYKELCNCYSSYMNYIFDVSFPIMPYVPDVKKPLDKNYYSFYYDVFTVTDGFQGRLLTKDLKAYKAAYESHQDFLRNLMGGETDEEKKIREENEKSAIKKEKRPFRYIECWCDPFSFYPSGFADKYEIIKTKSEPLGISDRYASFARRLLVEKNSSFWFGCHCLKKAVEKDSGFAEREKALILLVCEKCSTTDYFDDYWKILRNALAGVPYVQRRYIEFIGKRILDNLEKMKNTVIKNMNASRCPVSYEEVKKVESIKSEKRYSSIDYCFECTGNMINTLPEFMRGELCDELNRQKSIVDSKFNEIISYLNERITDYNAKKFWIPGNRCQYCGGNFKGVLKKVCVRCGKEKDYK